MLSTNLKQQIYQTPWSTLYRILRQKGQIPVQDPKTKLECVLWRGFWDIQWFAEFFFPHYCDRPFSRMHLELFDLMEQGTLRRGQKRIIAAPRGHAKTTLMLVIQIIHAICYEYEPFIIIIAQSGREAEERISNILDELRTNTRLIECFGPLAPPKGLASQNGFVTRNNIRVKAMSKGQSIRGTQKKNNRPSLIILDDVETLEGTLNPEQREKTVNWFNKDILPAGQTDGSTNVTVIGTRLHHESLISYLLNQPDWQRRQYQAVESFADNAQLWEEWKQIYTQLDNPNREADAEAFFQSNRIEMLMGTEVLWPDMEPYLRLMKLQVALGKRAFYSEKQNEPFDPADQIFDMSQAAYFDWNEKQQTVHWHSTEKTIRRSELHTVYAYLDPALGESGTTGDFSAIIVAGKDAHGYMYVLDAVIKHLKTDAQIEEIVRLHRRWEFDLIYVEDVQFQRLLIPQIQNQLRADGYQARVLGNHPRGNKDQRIGSLQPYIANHQLLFRSDISQHLIDQLNHFPTGKDDGPDALEGVVSKLMFYRSPDKPIQRRRIKRRPSVRPSR